MCANQLLHPVPSQSLTASLPLKGYHPKRKGSFSNVLQLEFFRELCCLVVIDKTHSFQLVFSNPKKLR